MKLKIYVLGIVFGLAWLPALGQPGSDEYHRAILDAFRDGVVKVDVTTNMFQKDPDRCVSQGTGFLISATYMITAEHVYNLPPDCGDRIIMISSRRHKAQALAIVVDSVNDIALLRIQSPLSGLCALRVNNSDVYNSAAYRFGIPRNMPDARSEFTRIDFEDSGFKPLVLLTPSFSEQGDSGGPVLHLFYVVGVTRARHPSYPALSFMTIASAVRELMTRHKVHVERADECSLTQKGFNSASRIFTINAPLSPAKTNDIFIVAMRNSGLGPLNYNLEPNNLSPLEPNSLAPSNPGNPSLQAEFNGISLSLSRLTKEQIIERVCIPFPFGSSVCTNIPHERVLRSPITEDDSEYVSASIEKVIWDRMVAEDPSNSR